MVVINNNGVEYNVDKAIKNWTEYNIGWITREEYDRVVALLNAANLRIIELEWLLATANNRIAELEAQVASLQQQLAEANKRANIDVQYQSWAIYNWDWNMMTWWDTDSYALIYRDNVQRPVDYTAQLRFENDDYFVFWGFMPISWANKTSYWTIFVSPFDYFTINKTTNVITRGQWWVSWYSTSFWWYSVYRCLRQNVTPNATWIEYETEYRNYYYRNWYTNSYASWNIAWYFYIKKDLSAMWYVPSDDAFQRNAYWRVETDYATEHDMTYDNSWTWLFSDYNVDKIGDYDCSNVLYGWKLYTALWYWFKQDYSNDWYWFWRVYTVTKPSS